MIVDGIGDGVGDGDGGESLVSVMASVVIAGDDGCRSVAYNMAVRARGHSSSSKPSVKEQTL